MQLANYLFFTTQCEEALSFYTACGLGQVSVLLRHGDLDIPVEDAAMAGKVMHARFEGPGILFFASDNHDAEPMRGSSHILLMKDRSKTLNLFDRLAKGGRVTTPLAMQPWGSYYGKLTDKFGVQWMLDCIV
ncbi:VOC family protein [uncultured Thalassospira sp.]|uniref:VOC family protein n=1 Tax=uncultured Thalassospira sp. TaxID=404382 RepID=UPI0030D977FB|tara:strand:- start:3638 stop:4033 length:396 start_codon:yes stop_codon:yes gene_type:complete